MDTKHDPGFPSMNHQQGQIRRVGSIGMGQKFCKALDREMTTTRASPINKCEALQERRSRPKEQLAPIHSSINIIQPPFTTRLFDNPSAFSIAAVRGASLMLVGCHDGVMTSRDSVRPDSTRARAGHCTIVAAVGA